ncbi:MAG: O-antigen ligase family protein [Candidatus Uhrbacteria bacterium]|nr:O-antigen ligase family protein [Patescibacteria group bacterium]MBU1906731.1 O-antigen ligase family protein [Patescibacteria group bacterium]
MGSLREQFFGRTFWFVLAGAVLAHLVAFYALHTVFEGWIVIAIFVLVFRLAIKRLDLALLVAFAELFVGSHGHLFSFEWFSVRMAIYAAIMLAWLVLLINKKITINLKDQKLYPFYALGFAVVLGVTIALARGNVKADIFNDMNAYLFLGYLIPMLSVQWDAIKRRRLLQTLAAGSAFIVAEVLALLYLFSHASPELEKIMYTFFRDARIAELTRVNGDIFRVFLQSEFTVVAAFLILMSALYFLWHRRQDRNIVGLGLIATISTIVISLSRSFWVGAVAGSLVVFLLVLFAFRIKPLYVFKRCLLLVVFTIAGVALLWNLLAFPFPAAMGVGGFGSLLSDRATELDEAAARSRWALVGPMMEEIKESPVMGRGFGTVVEYESADPRVQNLQGGIATTYSFEWGYLEIWLKMGFLGILAFAWIFVFYVMTLWNAAHDEESHWLGVGLLATVMALFATHVFSPYLNHPIGLGFLIFLIPFLKTKTPQLSLAALRERIRPKAVIDASPAISSRISTD